MPVHLWKTGSPAACLADGMEAVGRNWWKKAAHSFLPLAVPCQFLSQRSRPLVSLAARGVRKRLGCERLGRSLEQKTDQWNPDRPGGLPFAERGLELGNLAGQGLPTVSGDDII